MDDDINDEELLALQEAAAAAALEAKAAEIVYTSTLKRNKAKAAVAAAAASAKDDDAPASPPALSRNNSGSSSSLLVSAARIRSANSGSFTKSGASTPPPPVASDPGDARSLKRAPKIAAPGSGRDDDELASFAGDESPSTARRTPRRSLGAGSGGDAAAAAAVDTAAGGAVDAPDDAEVEKLKRELLERDSEIRRLREALAEKQQQTTTTTTTTSTTTTSSSSSSSASAPRALKQRPIDAAVANYTRAAAATASASDNDVVPALPPSTSSRRLKSATLFSRKDKPTSHKPISTSVSSSSEQSSSFIRSMGGGLTKARSAMHVGGVGDDGSDAPDVGFASMYNYSAGLLSPRHDTRRVEAIVERDETARSERDDDIVGVVKYRVDAATNLKEVCAGTVNRLVELLAPDQGDAPRQEYINDFMASYRMFLRPRELMRLLMARYAYAPHDTLTHVENVHRQKWQSTVRLRVINVVKKWIIDFVHDFESDHVLMTQLTEFIESLRGDNPQWYLRLLQALQEKGTPFIVGKMLRASSPIEAIAAAMKRREAGLINARASELHGKRVFIGADAVEWCEEHLSLGSRDEALAICQTLLSSGIVQLLDGTKGAEFLDAPTMYEFVLLDGEKGTSRPRPPPSLLPVVREKRVYSLAEFEPLEVARQMTIVDRDLFTPIVPATLEVKANQQVQLSGAGRDFIEHFNRTSRWVATEVVSMPRLDDRVAHVQQFVRVAEQLEKIRNYQSLFAIIGGLNLSSVNRLAKTWKEMKKKSEFVVYRRLAAFCDPSKNYATYREHLAGDMKAKLPGVPFLGLFLNDLTHINDGLDDRVEVDPERPGEGPLLINFEKCRLLSRVMVCIHQYQLLSKGIDFRAVPEIQSFLRAVSALPEDELYDLSLRHEPRAGANKKDKKEEKEKEARRALQQRSQSFTDGRGLSSSTSPSRLKPVRTSASGVDLMIAEAREADDDDDDDNEAELNGAQTAAVRAPPEPRKSRRYSLNPRELFSRRSSRRSLSTDQQSSSTSSASAAAASATNKLATMTTSDESLSSSSKAKKSEVHSSQF